MIDNEEAIDLIEKLYSITNVEPTVWYLYFGNDNIAVKYLTKDDRDNVKSIVGGIDLYDNELIINKDILMSYGS